jgi:NitT/TauT family transport system substrate-binding protein
VFTTSTFRRSALALCLAGALSVTACSSEDDKDDSSTLVVAMGHEAPYPGEEAVLYAIPKGLGLFEEYGIDVQYETTAGSSVAAQLVQAGKADLGHGNPGTVFAAINNGAEFKVVYNIIPTYGSGLAVLPDSAIEAPADLEGATIGVASLSSSRLPEARQMAEEAGLDPDADVEFVAVGTGAQAASALESGKVDGLYLWDAAYLAIQLGGTDLRVIKDVFEDSENLLDYVQYASDEAIEEKSDALEKLGKAAAIAHQWALKNPDEALNLFYEAFPNAEATSEEARARDLEILKFTLEQFQPDGTVQKQWGETPESKVEATTAFLEAGGQLPEALSVDSYVDNQFVDAYNDFTPEDVAKAAPAS